MITRDEGLKLVISMLTNPNLVKHCLAVEAIMRALALKFNEDPEEWGLVGLLHDADYEMSKNQPEKHGLLLFETEPDSIPKDIAHAIKAHNPDNGFCVLKVQCGCNRGCLVALDASVQLNLVAGVILVQHLCVSAIASSVSKQTPV